MILTHLSNTTKKLWEKISFHKHFKDMFDDRDENRNDKSVIFSSFFDDVKASQCSEILCRSN